MTTVFRPRFGKYLSAAIMIICAAGIVTFTIRGGWSEFVATAPWLALVAGAGWALFWNPEVVVDESGVRLVNVLRTIQLPWPSIQRIDTRWALTLYTAYGKFTAWAAPAPSRFAAQDLSPGDIDSLPESTFAAGHSIRPGDSPHSPSGHAARLVRMRWEQLRDAGHLDDPRLEFDKPPVRWHQGTAIGALILVGVGLLTQLF